MNFQSHSDSFPTKTHRLSHTGTFLSLSCLAGRTSEHLYNVSLTIEGLLSDYDMRLRPNFGGGLLDKSSNQIPFHFYYSF